MAQMQTISIRIPDDDFQWLLAQRDSSAITPSETLRTLLSRARQHEAGLANFDRCLIWMRELTRTFDEGIAALERRQKIHSDLVSAIGEWVPQIMATLVSARLGDQDAEAIEIEALLAQQSFRLLTAILRAGITSMPATYDREILQRYLPGIIEIAQIISTLKGKE